MLKTALFYCIFAVIVYFVFQTALQQGVFSHYHQHHPGKCRQINGDLLGSEDFEVTRDGQAFITSGYLFAQTPEAYKKFVKARNVKGKILTFDFNKADKGLAQLKMRSTEKFNLDTFHPHGITVLEDPKGQHLIYVVNHPSEDGVHFLDDRIEKFRYIPEKKELLHLRSFFSDKFHMINDLALVREDVFYVTETLYFKNLYAAMLETIFPLSLGSVLFYNGSTFETALSGLKLPHGLVGSPDGKYFYVSMHPLQLLAVYSRDPSDNSLTLIEEIHLHTGLDKLLLSQSGDAIYGGGTPLMKQIGAFFHSPEHEESKIAAQVLRLPLKDGRVQKSEIIELFYDHGNLISGSSVAWVYNGQLLVGSIMDSMVLCDTSGPDVGK